MFIKFFNILLLSSSLFFVEALAIDQKFQLQDEISIPSLGGKNILESKESTIIKAFKEEISPISLIFFILLFLSIIVIINKNFALKRLETKAIQSFEYFKTIFDSSSSMVVIIDDRLIIQANQKFLDFYRCLDIDAFYKKHHRLLETFDKVENEEYIFNDGLEGIWIERVFLSPNKHFKVAIKGEHFSLKIQKIANDTSNQYLLTLSDITAMVKEKDDLVTVVDSASHTIKEQQEQLKKQAQKAAMGEMISIIAHQLKQPLSAISAMATNIKVKNGLDLLTLDFCLEINEKIIRDVHFMSTTIDDFRNFFRPDKESSLFSIHDNIQEVLQLLKPLLERHKITVNYQYDEDTQVRSFPTELKQVLMNIINNAKDVFLEVDNDKPQINIEFKKDDRYCSIVLSDNAGGIPDEILPNIFKPYFTTKGAEGTGLGLHMTKMIIEDSMKGSIEVANNEAGATFTIHIPLNVNVVLEIPEEVS